MKKILKQWEKEDETKKAEAFSQEDFENFIKTAPNDPFHFPRKIVMMILAVFGLLRKKEVTYISLGDLTFNPDCILVQIQRRKQKGTKKKVSFAITHD